MDRSQTQDHRIQSSNWMNYTRKQNSTRAYIEIAKQIFLLLAINGVTAVPADAAAVAPVHVWI